MTDKTKGIKITGAPGGDPQPAEDCATIGYVSKNTGSTFDEFLKEEGINLDKAYEQLLNNFNFEEILIPGEVTNNVQNNSPVFNLIEALKEDEEYKQTWIANIAMAFQDEYYREYRHKGVHEISNKAAENFINMLIKVDNTDD